MKKILILGGTGFVGRILTENLVASGEKPVLFNRGKRNPDIFPELRKITGDRNTADIKQIAGESWDTVIDFSCMHPDNLDEVTDLLKGNTGRFIFISTLSVFPMTDPQMWSAPVGEDTPTLPCTSEQRKDPNVMPAYGEKKAECERILLGKEWLDAVIFRPGLIYGRYDHTDRFYYWLYRAKVCERVLIPDHGKERFTATYSEDFAKLIESAIYTVSHNKVYNASTHTPVSLIDNLKMACRLLDKSPEIISREASFFVENKIEPWNDIPLWVGDMDLCMDNSKALRDFPVKFQSFEDSLKGCIEYYSSLDWKAPITGISVEKEIEYINMVIK
ncbi:MAG: NAD-dependent epimerase/dehydratase family protein [Ignavibacteria bacterium]|nr:NAD-dependent epimerase/dehydratase family protein [Ignavibacteria bacterium]